MRLEFYLDIVCPYAWLASTLVEALADRYGAELVWRPVLLGGLFKALGAPMNPGAAGSAARQAQDALDLARQARLMGLPLRRHPRHPLSSLQAQRLAAGAPEALRVSIIKALFKAYHVDNQDIDDMSYLTEFARGFGLDAAATVSAGRDPLRASTDEALGLGMFGVPSFAVRDAAGGLRGWTWGRDRLHGVEALLGGPSRHPGFVQGETGGHLRFVYDFASPFAWLASAAVPRLARARGATLEPCPILLGALFRAVGTADVPLFTMSSAKQAWVMRDLAEQAAWWGLPFSFPAAFPLRTVLPLRVAVQAPEAMAPLFTAAWGQGRDLSRPEVVAEVLTDAGLDAAGLIEGAERPEVKQALRANTEGAAARGVCGVPTVEVGGLRVWGQDRLHLVEAALHGRLGGP